MGVMTEVVGQIRYANGVNFDPASRTLYVSEHLARRVLALTLDPRQRVTATHGADRFRAARRDPGVLLSAGRAGRHRAPAGAAGGGRIRRGQGPSLRPRRPSLRSRSRCPCRSSTRSIWDDAGNLYAGGSFQNTRPPFEGAVRALCAERVGTAAIGRSRLGMVGAAGFEPATCCSQSSRATRLRYAPVRAVNCRTRRSQVNPRWPAKMNRIAKGLKSPRRQPNAGEASERGLPQK